MRHGLPDNQSSGSSESMGVRGQCGNARSSQMRPALKAWGVYFAAAVLLGFAPVPPVSVAEAPQAKKADTAGDWPMYNHDVSGWRYNALEKTLSPDNVGKLVALNARTGKVL